MLAQLAHSSSRALEFGSLRDLIQGYASSPLGQERIAGLCPSLNREWIENQHRLTTEIREYRRVGGRFEFSGLLDVSRALEKSGISAVSSTPEEFDAFVRKELDRWGQVLKDSGIQLN